MQAQDPRTKWLDAAGELGLVRKAQRGDRRAFAALLRHYVRPVYRLAFALTHDVRVAVSVTHAAVLKAKDGVRWLAEGQRFFPLVAGIVRNLAGSRPRAGAEAGALAPAPRASQAAAAPPGGLLRELDGLEPDEQAGLALLLVEWLSYSQIETVLRAAPGTARSLLSGARGRLLAQVPAGENGASHLTLDLLSANLDGVLETVSSDAVRHHLEACEHCRARGVRIASTNDALAALLTHDPDDRFVEALGRFLEDQIEAEGAPDSLPPELDQAVGEEIARLEAGPSPPAPRDAGPIQVLTASEVRAVGPAEAPSPVRPPRTRLVRGRAGRLIGAALLALVPLSAGLYVAVRGLRALPEPAQVSRGLRGGTRADLGPVPTGAHAGDPGLAIADSSAKPGTAADSGVVLKTTATSSPAAAASQVSPPRVATSPATRRERAPAASPRPTSAPRATSAPSAAPAAPPVAAAGWGILCGQVRDERGAAVVRARVLLADLEVGALTDHRGRFCISVPVGARTVSVIALGFATQRRTVTVKRTTPELALTLRAATEP